MHSALLYDKPLYEEELLIKEARRHARRRHIAVGVSVAVVLAIATLAGVFVPNIGASDNGGLASGQVTPALLFAKRAGTTLTSLTSHLKMICGPQWCGTNVPISLTSRSTAQTAAGGVYIIKQAASDVEGGLITTVSNGKTDYLEVPGPGLIVRGHLVHWISYPAANIAPSSVFNSVPLTPITAFPAVIGTAATIGHRVIDGRETTGFRVTISLAKVIAEEPAARRAEFAQWFKQSSFKYFDAAVWMSADGVAREFDWKLSYRDVGYSYMYSYVELLGYSSSRLHVNIPATGQTATSSTYSAAEGLWKVAQQACPERDCPGLTTAPKA